VGGKRHGPPLRGPVERPSTESKREKKRIRGLNLYTSSSAHARKKKRKRRKPLFPGVLPTGIGGGGEGGGKKKRFTRDLISTFLYPPGEEGKRPTFSRISDSSSPRKRRKGGRHTKRALHLCADRRCDSDIYCCEAKRREKGR